MDKAGLSKLDDLRKVFSRSETHFLKRPYYAVQKILVAHHNAETC